MGIHFGSYFGFNRADISAYTAGSTQNNVATTQPFTRVSSTGAAAFLTGLAAPSPAQPGQMRLLVWGRNGTVTLKDQDTGSLAANRLEMTADTDLSSGARKGLLFWYDDASARWRSIS